MAGNVLMPHELGTKVGNAEIIQSLMIDVGSEVEEGVELRCHCRLSGRCQHSE